MWPGSSLTLYMLSLHSELFGPSLSPVLLFCWRQCCQPFPAETFSILILQGLFYTSSAQQKETHATEDEMFFFPFYDCCHSVNWGGTDGTIKPPAWNLTGPTVVCKFEEHQAGHLQQGSSVWTWILAMKVAISRCSGREHQITVPVRGTTLYKTRVKGCVWTVVFEKYQFPSRAHLFLWFPWDSSKP